eukprot:CAMPEP_0206175588 /NCGR_PEP_ID=MMETSP1474-20131121/55386_1 /ASSEMBLY_ACC=CAM_ASM_001110 /TAXON_ID=97495 /ORGANISM="Imantonia sp., Strain RCC918" /LENGTH=162 /DNA_ID=CAMNT_0053585917 /DNA_START=291 /DNA_END=776 /DNA_ORIENTATION=-
MELAAHRIRTEVRVILRDLDLGDRRCLAVRTEVRELRGARVKAGRADEVLAGEVAAGRPVAARGVEWYAARPDLEAVLVAKVARVRDEPGSEAAEGVGLRRLLEAAEAVLAHGELDDAAGLVRLQKAARLPGRHRRRLHSHPRGLDGCRGARVSEEARLAEG